MKNFSTALFNISLVTASSAILAATTSPAQAHYLQSPPLYKSFDKPVDAVGQLKQNYDTAWLAFDVLQAPSNSSEYKTLGKNYLSLGVIKLDDNHVGLKLKNEVTSTAGSRVSSAAIESVYIHDTKNLFSNFVGFVDFCQEVGFTAGARTVTDSKLTNLNIQPSKFISDWSAKATSTTNLIHKNEYLGMIFKLADNKTVDDIFVRMDTADFRVGINVAKLGSDGKSSATYQNVPEPMTILGSGIALGFGCLLKRRAAAKAKLSKTA